jgi:putative oxidoreductase
MRDVGLLTLRVVTGGLLAGHGAQKLFGTFGGPGMKGTKGMMQAIGVHPPHLGAPLAGGAEFAGGALTALGLAWPLGPITMLAPMAMATAKVHWGKPIWVTSGGAELPVTNMAAATALALAGPGCLSLDHAFGIRLPRPLIGLAFLATIAGIVMALRSRPPAQPQAQAPTEEAPSSEKGESEKEAAARMQGM